MSQKSKVKNCLMLALIMCLTSGLHIFPYFFDNHSGGGFGGGGDGERSVSLESYVIQGAGYFLDAYSNAMAYSQKVELSGNIKEIKALLDKAVESMTNANATYTTLKNLADNTPYNMEVISRLEAFNYEGLKEANAMLMEPFKRMEKYLSKGDIRSIYGETLRDTETLLEYLTMLKTEADGGKMPSIPVTWKLNQQFSRTLMFGQYVAQVFDAVLKDMN